MTSMTNLIKYLLPKWDNYKYRFVPWIAATLKNRSVRTVKAGCADNIVTENEICSALVSYFNALDGMHMDSNISPKETHNISRNQSSLDIMEKVWGFQIKVMPSHVVAGGQGVLVTKGTVPKGALVACYPGTIYQRFEPTLIQSLGNSFMFRCIDGILIDGNNTGLSRFLFRSCSQRDRVGPFFTCDPSWLNTYPVSSLGVGQFVNNQNKENSANVAYQEFDLPEEFPFHLRKFVPNVFFTSSATSLVTRLTRIVVLVSTREIQQGEELLSTYFTIVYK